MSNTALGLGPGARADALCAGHSLRGWRSLDKADRSFLASAFTDAGAMVVIPNYSLCPGAAMERIPLQLLRLEGRGGRPAAPVCEELAGRNHFDILHDLADPQGRSHQLARKLLDLRWFSALTA